MRITRIRQLEKLVRGLQSDGYDVKVFVNSVQKRLVIHIKVDTEEAEEIMAQWNDLRRVNGG